MKPKQKLSSKTLWALEKHQHSGVDFQFGFETQLNHAVPEWGTGELNFSYGLLTDVIFSPALRLETGIHLGNRIYDIMENELGDLAPEVLDKFPGFDPSTGDIIQIDLTEFPGYVDKSKTEPNNEFENSTQVLILNVESTTNTLKTHE